MPGLNSRNKFSETRDNLKKNTHHSKTFFSSIFKFEYNVSPNRYSRRTDRPRKAMDQPQDEDESRAAGLKDTAGGVGPKGSREKAWDTYCQEWQQYVQTGNQAVAEEQPVGDAVSGAEGSADRTPDAEDSVEGPARLEVSMDSMNLNSVTAASSASCDEPTDGSPCSSEANAKEGDSRSDRVGSASGSCSASGSNGSRFQNRSYGYSYNRKNNYHNNNRSYSNSGRYNNSYNNYHRNFNNQYNNNNSNDYYRHKKLDYGQKFGDSRAAPPQPLAPLSYLPVPFAYDPMTFQAMVPTDCGACYPAMYMNPYQPIAGYPYPLQYGVEPGAPFFTPALMEQMQQQLPGRPMESPPKMAYSQQENGGQKEGNLNATSPEKMSGITPIYFSNNGKQGEEQGFFNNKNFQPNGDMAGLPPGYGFPLFSPSQLPGPQAAGELMYNAPGQGMSGLWIHPNQGSNKPTDAQQQQLQQQQQHHQQQQNYVINPNVVNYVGEAGPPYGGFAYPTGHFQPPPQ